MIFHRHKWIKIKETYAKSPSNLESMQDAPPDLMEKILFGVTTILWECEKCQKIKKETLLGKEKPDNEILYDPGSNRA